MRDCGSVLPAPELLWELNVTTPEVFSTLPGIVHLRKLRPRGNSLPQAMQSTGAQEDGLSATRGLAKPQGGSGWMTSTEDGMFCRVAGQVP